MSEHIQNYIETEPVDFKETTLNQVLMMIHKKVVLILPCIRKTLLSEESNVE